MPDMRTHACTRAQLADLDAAHLWHPWSPASTERNVLVEGRGCYVFDLDGRRYLDAKGGVLNASCGYGRPEIVDAVAAQTAQLMVADTASFSTVPAILLAARIAELLPPPLMHTFFCSSGSEATETAMKLARMYHALRGAPDRRIIASLDLGYHGATTGAAALTSAPFVRHLVGLEREDRRALSAPTRERVADRGAEALADELASLADEVGADRIAACIVEPVLGIAGVIIPPVEYLVRLREICAEHGILLILDEVLTGFGRTGRMFAFERSGVLPDIISTSKGISGGYVPLAAVTATDEVFDVLAGDPLLGGFRHGHTMAAHPVACAAALATIDVIVTDGLAGNSDKVGQRLLRSLQPLRDLPNVTDVRGLGLLIGVEFGSEEMAAAATAACYQSGMIVRHQGDVVTLCPPLILSAPEADEAASILSAAVAQLT